MPSSLPNPWTGDDYECGFPVTLLAELAMRAASNAIREKPNWWEKYKDPSISGRWRSEIKEASNRRGGGNVMTDKQIDYVFKELEWYAEKRQKQIDDGVSAPIEEAIDGTRRSDGLIPQELKERLLKCVEKLKDVPDHLLDWHPGSNKQVLDLVHPSLFPVVSGRTRVTKEDAIPAMDFIGQGEVLNEPLSKERGELGIASYHSKKYQWLPTDFEITEGGKVKARSYINNLHPIQHKDMYPVLEEIFEKFVPMFEEVLADMRDIDSKKSRLDADPYGWYDAPDYEAEGFDEDDHYENRVPRPVEIPEFEPREESIKYDLKSRKNLQVIVKLANIELSPENPKYPGGTWHVEGMANENIVASGIYYYHSENISESRLNFRIQVQEPGYEQSDDRGVMLMYGLANDEPLVQYLDGVITKQDRCIAFPNIYQHQVQPFTLEDPTKPGSRSILVFFLVDPEQPILSTTNVPPQQKEWSGPIGLMQTVAEKMPPEIFAKIDELLDWPMDLKEAKEHREELMKERKFFVKKTNEEMFERLFSLCEH
ncbi:hypothetical protein BGX21_009424 [Mortierella sp. AD011]|nr:hypothetical protein BGX20_010255 [Mortierella sp. AD010]KAF9396705.1 hypothetical protein BGX21_009424 [Mortierella sp. AD011]